jgi:tRNA A37 threonylcarbamoyladenosine synthetase subunit TsaC/SUA5/YrdC
MPVKITGKNIAADAQRVFEAVRGGGIAIIHVDVGYAVLAHSADAVRRIYAAKRRSFDKPTGLLGNHALHEALHILGERERAMVRRITQDFDLPLAVIAPYRQDHPLLDTLDPFVRQQAVKGDTLNILLNAGELRNAIADLAVAHGILCAGSSANVSKSGSKYRLEDVDPEIRAVADVETDYGLCAHHNAQGLSSTMVDFTTFRVQRAGACFERIADVMRREFGVELKRPA